MITWAFTLFYIGVCYRLGQENYTCSSTLFIRFIFFNFFLLLSFFQIPGYVVITTALEVI